jgi:hypothetical protein
LGARGYPATLAEMDAGQRADVLAMWQVMAEPLERSLAGGAGAPSKTPISVLRQLARAPASLGDVLQAWAFTQPRKTAPPSGGLTPFEAAQVAKGVPLEKIRRLTGRA